MGILVPGGGEMSLRRESQTLLLSASDSGKREKKVKLLYSPPKVKKGVKGLTEETTGLPLVN